MVWLLGILQRRTTPDHHRVVSAAADDPCPIRTECDARDPIGMSFECNAGLTDLFRQRFYSFKVNKIIQGEQNYKGKDCKDY
jgi:hypothetical protein